MAFSVDDDGYGSEGWNESSLLGVWMDREVTDELAEKDERWMVG